MAEPRQGFHIFSISKCSVEPRQGFNIHVCYYISHTLRTFLRTDLQRFYPVRRTLLTINMHIEP